MIDDSELREIRLRLPRTDTGEAAELRYVRWKIVCGDVRTFKVEIAQSNLETHGSTDEPGRR
jgi:hypothetical protein